MGEGDRRPRHIFVGPDEVAGYYASLSQGLIRAGARVTFVDMSGHAFQYDRPDDQPKWSNQLAKGLRRIRGGAAGRGAWRWWAWAAARTVATPFVFVWALVRCDTFVFGFGRSLIGLWDLPLLRLAGKRVVVSFSGSDVRPPYLGGKLLHSAGGLDPERLIRTSRKIKQRVRRIERWAGAVVVHAPTAQFLERPFARSLALGFPFEPPAELPERTAATSGIRLLHAPSSPAVKGTAVIRAAVEQLRTEGIDLTYVEITGRPHREVLEAIASTDLVVDQIYSDSPLAGLSTEAAGLGVPSLVAGYGLRSIAAREREAGALPEVIVCEPDELVDELRTALGDRERLQAIGADAQRFVLDRWNPEAVGQRYLEVVDGTWPPEGWVDPASIEDVGGCGASRDLIDRAVTAMVSAGGASSLQLDDKPALRDRLVSRSESPVQ